MDTIRFRPMTWPKDADELLQSYVLRNRLIPSRAIRVTGLDELTDPLRRLAKLCRQDLCAWSAWALGQNIWFFNIESSIESQPRSQRPMLEIRGYDEFGVLMRLVNYVRVEDDLWVRI